mgnify:CR=1 FL=1
MRYYVDLVRGSDAPTVVDVTELPSGALEVTVGGRKVAVDVASLGATLNVHVDGRVVDLTTEGTPPEIGAIASGQRAYVRVESERMRAALAAKKGGASVSDKSVKAPMPGRVVRMLVAEGDDVDAGQSLCVVEAMKMENEVKARAAGKIAKIHVAEGETVDANAKLISLA